MSEHWSKDAGVCYLNRWEELEEKIKQAIEIATLIGDGEQVSTLAPAEPVIEELTAGNVRDFRQISLKEKAETMKNYSNIIVNFSPKIQSSIANYADRYTITHFANSEGTYIKKKVLTLAFILRQLPVTVMMCRWPMKA